MSMNYPRWRNTPRCFEEAKDALENAGPCLACGARLLLPIVRPPVEIWKAHCNHCGSEVPLAVMLNREHWQKSAKRTPWKLKPIKSCNHTKSE